MELGKVGQVGVGMAVEAGSSVSGWVGYGIGLAMLASGVYIGLRGQFLYGGLVVVAAPVVGGVVGHYLASAPGTASS